MKERGSLTRRPDLAQTGGWRSGRACPSCPSILFQTSEYLISDINLVSYRQSIVHFDAEISNSAFNLGMAKQKLDGPKIARAPIDQGRFRAPQRVRAKQPRV